jgi:hypothetical protein
MRYFRAELAPPKMEDMPAIKQGFANLQKAFYEQRWKQMTTRVSGIFILGFDLI